MEQRIHHNATQQIVTCLAQTFFVKFIYTDVVSVPKKDIVG